MDVMLMKNYLTNICHLEGELYAMEKLRNELIGEINYLKSYKGQQNMVANKKYFDFRDAIELLKTFGQGGLGVGFVGGLVALFVVGYKPKEMYGYLKTIFIRGPLTGLKIGILLGILFIIWTIVDNYRVNKKNINYVEMENNIINTSNDIEKNNRNTKANIIQNEVNILNMKIKETSEVLNRYYSYNWIYDKYRNYVAVSSFLEYFNSGRCTKLGGHEGAYNIYEQELKFNIIVGKLDTIIERLDEIKNNQYVLYSEIRQQNNRIESLRKGVYSCARSLKSIQSSNEIIAYNIGISARNTEFLKWLETLR